MKSATTALAGLAGSSIAAFQARFAQYLEVEWNALQERRNANLAFSNCLREFDDSAFERNSGQSFWGPWEKQFFNCSKLGGRYIIFCHALRQSRSWRLNVFGVSSHGQVLSEAWASEIEKDVLDKLVQGVIPHRQYRDSTHLGVCVPTLCPRYVEPMLGWHVVLKMFGYPGYPQTASHGAHRARAPKRSQILMRLHGSTLDLQAAQEMKTELSKRGLPSWYLQPFNWKVRPPLYLGFQGVAKTREFFHKRWGLFQDRLQIILSKRQALCSIPKVGLTQFFMLMQRVGQNNVSYSHFNKAESRWETRLSGWFASNLFWGDRRWKYAVFVRDPLERFVSAFKDKCMKPSASCGDDRKKFWENVSSISPMVDQVRAFRLFVALPVPTPKMLEDDHWIPQSVYLLHGCGFPWQRLDFVGLMTADKLQMNIQVQAMFHQFGFSLEHAAKLANEHFPRKGFANELHKKHSNIHGKIGHVHSTFRAFYSQKETLQQVMRYVRQDYFAFGLKLPEWTRGLTNSTIEL